MKVVNWSTIHTTREIHWFTFLLRVLSFFYGLAIQCRLVVYKTGLLRSKHLPAYVMSVGNITTGGTGKTPFVAMLAKLAKTHGFRVAILSRGYKGKRSNESLVVSDGEKMVASVNEAGGKGRGHRAWRCPPLRRRLWADRIQGCSTPPPTRSPARIPTVSDPASLSSGSSQPEARGWLPRRRTGMN